MTIGIEQALYPFKSQWLHVSDGWLHYIDEGEGQPVVMLHGNPDWSFSYRKVFPELSHAYRCLVLDQLGFGLSAKPATASYHPQAQADRLAEWIQSLGLRQICFVVNDWGGPVAFAFTQRYPERVHSLVIMNTWAWPLQPYWGFTLFSSLMSGRSGQWLTRYANAFSQVLVWLAVYHKQAFSGRVHAHYRKPYQRPADRVAQVAMPYYLTGASGWFQALYEQVGLLAAKPTALVWGLRDPAFRPVFLRNWQRLMPSAETFPLGRAGHFPQEDQPKAVVAAVRAVTA